MNRRSQSPGIQRGTGDRSTPRFINPATGSDANTGETSGAAWASEVPLNTALNTAGHGITDVVFDTSGAPLYLTTGINVAGNAAGVRWRSATPGVKADIRAYKILNNAVFTQPNAGTYANVWSTTDTGSRSVLWERGGSNAYDLIWYTHPLGANFAAVAATLNTTPGSFWTDGTTMYFRPLTGNDPVNDGKTYVRSRIFAADHAVNIQARATIRDLMIGGSCVAGPSDVLDVVGGAYALCLTPTAGTSSIQTCYLYNGAKHNLGLIEGASTSVVVVEDVQCEQASPWTSQTLFVSYATTSTNMRHTYRRCTSTKNVGLAGSMAGAVDTTQPVMYNHNTGVGTQYDSITLDACSFPGMTINQSSSGVAAGGYSITNNTRFGGGAMHDVDITRCHIDRSSVTVQDAATSSVRIRNCKFTPTGTPTTGGDGTYRLAGSILIENCTIDMAGTTGGYAGALWFSLSNVSTTIFTFKNNIFDGAGRAFPFQALASNHVLTMDRNVYSNLIADARIVLFPGFTVPAVTGSIDTLPEWKVRGFDLNSVNSAALLNGDYTPTSSSPARNLAVTTLTEDYIGAITPRVTSGAYEYRP